MDPPSHHRPCPAPLSTLLALGLATLLAMPGLAESEIVLPVPARFGDIEAGTFDESGKRLGDARVRLERIDGGDVRLEAISAIDGSARTSLSARFETTASGQLRLVSQRTQSTDESGTPMGVMWIDHRRREGLCQPAPGSGGEISRVALPDRDRVVNVPLHLLFQPLVTGSLDAIDFQLLICRSGARLLKARASRVRTTTPDAQDLIEVRYDIDVGPLLSRLAAPFLPRLSVWFDRQDPGSWIAQRGPLFSKGPNVVVVRSDLSPQSLGVGR